MCMQDTISRITSFLWGTPVSSLKIVQNIRQKGCFDCGVFCLVYAFAYATNIDIAHMNSEELDLHQLRFALSGSLSGLRPNLPTRDDEGHSTPELVERRTKSPAANLGQLIDEAAGVGVSAPSTDSGQTRDPRAGMVDCAPATESQVETEAALFRKMKAERARRGRDVFANSMRS